MFSIQFFHNCHFSDVQLAPQIKKVDSHSPNIFTKKITESYPNKIYEV
jgi:hypothetical protein